MAKVLVILGIFLSFAAHSALSIKSYNIRNFQSSKSTNLELLKSVLLKEKADLIGVQEINNSKLFKEFIETELSSLNYKVVMGRCGGRGNQKLGFIYNANKIELTGFKEDIRMSGKDPSCNQSSRPAAIGLFLDHEDRTQFTAINVHLKAGGCDRCIQKRNYQLKVLSEIIKSFQKMNLHHIIALGDFNSTEYIKKGHQHKVFKSFVSHHNMIDSAETMNCTSYWSGRNRGDGLEEPSLLDHILVSKSFMQRYPQIDAKVSLHCKTNRCQPTSSQNMGPSYYQVSDHCPVSLDMR